MLSRLQSTLCSGLMWLAVLAVFSGCQSESTFPSQEKASKGTGSSSLGNQIAEIRQSLSHKNLKSARQLSERLLLQFPDDDRVRLVAAEVFATSSEYRTAIDLLSTIDVGSSEGRLAADLHYRLRVAVGERSKAADVLLEAIRHYPDADAWKHVAWQLLNHVGRRHEASEVARQLCQTGKSTRDQRLSLLRWGGAYPTVISEGDRAENHFLPGLGMARWYFTNGQYRAALRELESQTDAVSRSPAAEAFYGRLLAETQQVNKLKQWLAAADESLMQSSDYWVAMGSYFLDQLEHEAAVGALLEAVFRDPTDDQATHRLALAFRGLDRDGDSEQFHYRGILIVQSYQLGEKLVGWKEANDAAEQKLSTILLKLGRPFESLAWKLESLPPSASRARQAVRREWEQLLLRPKAFKMANEMALLDIDRRDFPTKSLRGRLADTSITSRHREPRKVPITATPEFQNIAAEVGVDFQWYLDDPIELHAIALYEVLGGGIASIDYDLDGWPDLYLAQGSGKPPTDSATRSNAMFRNIGGKFIDTTSNSHTEDLHYSSGISVGDVNQDGFPDLFLASQGRNRLLINNGDGTFEDATDKLGACADRFSSSVAIADIDGDDLPDLYEAVYVEMAGAFKEPERDANGEWIMQTPLLFYADEDRWFRNKGDGSFVAKTIEMPATDRGTGLGVAITDIDQDLRNEIFVANDARPNHLLVMKNDSLVNIADAIGLANSFEGASYACMGIATGDFDRNGSIDLHVTNFFDEPANLYLQKRGGGFVDRARAFHLEAGSRPYVGFGTKAVDFDRNGWLDLIVTNGHVFDRRRQQEGFAMPPQLLMNRGDRFVSIDIRDNANRSDYWSGEYLGRAVMTTDFDRDNRIDIVIGHLDQPVAILRNETETEGNWIHLRLVGTQSERDAIGARVRVTADGQRWHDWVVAGDGYLASDEPITTIAIGDAESIETVEVVWPSGRRQTFPRPERNRSYLVVEGQPGLTDLTYSSASSQRPSDQSSKVKTSPD